jgi:hypothetical protein
MPEFDRNFEEEANVGETDVGGESVEADIESESEAAEDGVGSISRGGEGADASAQRQTHHPLKRGRMPQVKKNIKGPSDPAGWAEAVDVTQDAIGARVKNHRSSRYDGVKKTTEIVGERSDGDGRMESHGGPKEKEKGFPRNARSNSERRSVRSEESDGQRSVRCKCEGECKCGGRLRRFLGGLCRFFGIKPRKSEDQDGESTDARKQKYQAKEVKNFKAKRHRRNSCQRRT